MRKTTNDVSNKLPNFKSLAFGMLLGAFATSLAIFTFATSEITLRFPSRYTHHTKPQQVLPQQPQQDVPKDANSAAQKKVLNQTNNVMPVQTAEQSTIQEPRFDFYTELSKSSPEAATETLYIASSKEDVHLKSATKAINGYLIQAGGSFKKNVDADAIKARLSLNGFEAKVEPIRLLDGEQRYRILLGPVKTEKSAKMLQKQLRSIDIESVLVTTFAEEKNEG